MTAFVWELFPYVFWAALLRPGTTAKDEEGER